MIRNESTQIGEFNLATKAAPFESLNVADIGDVPINPYDIRKALDNITGLYSEILDANCIPLGMGGDHTLSLGVLRAMGKKYGPVAMIQIDAHADVRDTMFGEKIAHGTPFRRAVEEGVLDPKLTVQIGLRSYGYGPDDYDWPLEQGFRMIMAKDCWHKSLVPLMDSIRDQIGPDKPVYITFDIDGIDPAFCPGTGTPEIGGLTVIQALEIIRGCKGLNIIGADVVEVNPLFDPSRSTCLTGANLLFELLCILPGVKYH
jgi:guanidinobutyrase